MKFVNLVVAAIVAGSTFANAADYIASPPLTQVVTAGVNDCRLDGTVNVPFITWGADMGTAFANGNSKNTVPTSIFSGENISVELERVDRKRIISKG